MSNRGFRTTRVRVQATLAVAVLPLALVRIALTQGSGPTSGPTRPWRCLAQSVASGPVFRSIAAANCPPMPSILWPSPERTKLRTAEAIVPPGAPTGLAATVSGATVALKWTAPFGGGAPTSYVIQAGSSSGQSNLANADTGSAAPAVTATNVSSGTYFVRVLARNAAGTSPSSNEIVVSVAGACATPPGAPDALTDAVNGGAVALTWQPAAVGCAATSYVIQAGSAPGLSNLTNVSTGSAAPSFAAGNVSPGVYFVRVLATNAAGTSGPSNEISLSVAACSRPPGAPGGLAAFISASTVTLSWTAASGSPSDYRIEVGASPGAANLGVVDAGAATSLTASGVATGVYYVQARASNACGAGPASNTAVVIVGGAPPPVTVIVLHSFAPAEGTAPNTTVVQATDGNFYGTTNSGDRTVGSVYRMTPAGAFTTLHAFSGPDGAFPSAPLIVASDGNLYGTTDGGPNALGTVFRMSPAGAVTVLHVFTNGPTDGAIPLAGLVEASDGAFYGTTMRGGSGFGTIFRITGAGALTMLYAFTGGADGGEPRASLVQASDGNFYGTAGAGGAANRGTAFRITPTGAFSLLHTFTGGSDGGLPYSALIEGSDGNLYGTTSVSGGSANGGGTAFRMTLAGGFSLLHTFTPADGESPMAALVQGADGMFYGTTSGGLSSAGSVFMMTPSGTVTLLHAFVGGAGDGALPLAPLVLAGDAAYGVTSRGGANDAGTVYRVSR